MPEFTAIHVALLTIAPIIGAVAGWVLRGNRSDQEKAAVSAGWQEQVDAQRRENDRLVDQNKSLMNQVSHYQAQHADAKHRAKELSLAVQEAFQRRDALQRDIKDIRDNLETVLTERDQLAASVQSADDTEDLLRQKDVHIDKLAKELGNWQNRLPPLIDRYRVRNEEAERFEVQLAAARERILQLENARGESAANETRIEPVDDPDDLTDGLDVSNDSDEDVESITELSDEPVDVSDVDDHDRIADDDEPPLPRERRDDLKMIKGVGPAIEKTLNEMGIFRFRQIADMSEYDIDRVARRLKGFHSRIYREDWIGQARTLLDDAAHA